MLYAGYAKAITNIRLRRGLTQKQAVANVKAAMPHSKITHGTWSKYETGAKKLGASELPIILAGLGCTETELWQESSRVQKAHYYRIADEVREEQPQYDTSMAAGIMQGLWSLDASALPLAKQSRFSHDRTALADMLSNTLSLIDQLKQEYWENSGTPEEAQDEEDDQNRKT